MSEEVWREDGLVTFKSKDGDFRGRKIQLNYDTEEKLRKFFQDERDQELGRWRWPEDSNDS